MDAPDTTTTPPVDVDAPRAVGGPNDGEPEQTERPFYREPMFWTGVGVFVGGLLLTSALARRGAPAGCADCARRKAAAAAVDQHLGGAQPAERTPPPDGDLAVQLAAAHAANERLAAQVAAGQQSPAAGTAPDAAPVAPAPPVPAAAPANGAYPTGLADTLAALPANRAGLVAVPPINPPAPQ